MPRSATTDGATSHRYTYSAVNAALGKATFKVRVRLDDHEDNNPADNERTVETTIVVAQ